MGNTLRHSLLALSISMFAAAPSQAAIIDFTDIDAWGGADGVNWVGYTSPTTYDGVSVTVTSASATQFMTFNAEGGVFELACSLATLGVLDCDGDGLGIGDDEITNGYFAGGEALFVSFDQPVDITRIGFLDLYGPGGPDPDAEVAQWGVMFWDGSTDLDNSLTGTGSSLGLGLEVATVNLLAVKKLIFFGNGPSNSDFSLAGIDMTASAVPDLQSAPVPEPATLLLTGGGLFAAALRARRRRRA